PATVLEGIGREMTPSADGRSLPGASSTEPPPSFARIEAQRRRNLLFVAFGGFLILAGVIGFLFGREPRRDAAVAPLPPATPTQIAEAPVATPPVAAAPPTDAQPPVSDLPP